MPTPKETIDGLLGDGWYDTWKDLETQAAEELRRANINMARLQQFNVSAPDWKYYLDRRTLQSVAADFSDLMNKAAREESVDETKIKDLHDILALSVTVMENGNDALEAAFAIGFVGGLMAFALAHFAAVSRRAAALEPLLRELKTELEKAKSNVVEAWAQTAINFALTVVTIALPQVSLVVRGVMIVGQWAIDDALGPSTSTRATVGSKSSIIVSQMGDAIHDTGKFGEKAGKVSRGAGKVASVTGFMFDVNEVAVGYKERDKLQKMLNTTNKAYQELAREIRRHGPAIRQFLMDYERWQRAIKALHAQNAVVRDERDKDISMARYTVR